MSSYHATMLSALMGKCNRDSWLIEPLNISVPLSESALTEFSLQSKLKITGSNVAFNVIMKT